MKEKFNKFYNKSIDQRRDILKEVNLMDDLDNLSLPEDKANLMIENYVLNYELPLGLAFNFTIDGKDYMVPMATEEPSVIAAASNGAKTLGNFETSMEEKAVIGQIVLENITNTESAIKNLQENKDLLIDMVRDHSKSMIKRGGGPRKIWFDSFDDKYVTLYLSVDTCDAMGANTINTILEAISDKVEEITGADYLLRIISNNATESIVTSKVEVTMENLHKDIDQARKIAKRIQAATNYANLDVYRAVTHNKGAMNGIDAVVLATGNDTRAIETAINAYASRDGHYKSITSWTFDQDRDLLIGKIEIPLQVATVGGTISVNPMSKWALKVLDNPSARQLASVIASVGLAQNFSALRAIVTVGIQKGHMSLHARSVAGLVTNDEKERSILVERLKKADKINEDNARLILDQIRNEGK